MAVYPRFRRQRSHTYLAAAPTTKLLPHAIDSRSRALTTDKRRKHPYFSKLVAGGFGVFIAGWFYWSVTSAVFLRRQPPVPQTDGSAARYLPVDASYSAKQQQQHVAPPIPKNDMGNRNGAEHPLQSTNKGEIRNQQPVLTYYLESIATMNYDKKPFSRRHTTAKKLQVKSFPNATCSSSSTSSGAFLNNFPIDEFPAGDPFLPWIHDYFIREQPDDSSGSSSSVVQFVAQNRRRCETGEGKETVMKYWEPQIALFQSVPVLAEQPQGVNNSATATTQYRLAPFGQDAATAPETRFLCHFHNASASETTFSQFNIPYEFVNWRKHKGKPMFETAGTDVHHFEFSQLLFYCPIPDSFRHALAGQPQQQEGRSAENVEDKKNEIWMDLVPIRTPVRSGQWLLSKEHVGPDLWAKLPFFNTTEEYGTDHILPALEDSGRIANLPLCPTVSSTSRTASATEFIATLENNGRSNVGAPPSRSSAEQRRHRLVVCTWTAASYHRRGDRTIIQDAADRLEEWIVFHRLVGVDHVYVYDNTKEERPPSDPDDITQATSSSDQKTEESALKIVSARFPDFVTYVPWPATVCSNNRPNHKNPGERSSQYAAEASCRERFGSTTEWMSFIDTDEYLVPMRKNTTWPDLLDDFSQAHPDVHVLKMRSSRGRPRLDLLELLPDQTACKPQTRRRSRVSLDPCMTHRWNETFLRIYNCDYIKPPLPDRFARAMKQIYRPSFVLSHFVHYSTITADIVRYYRDWSNSSHATTASFSRILHNWEWGDAFLDELTQGTLVHAKSVLPYETMERTAHCQTGSKLSCPVGHPCPDSTAFNDSIHQLNLFVDADNKFCNCWLNTHVEDYWVPRLERALRDLSAGRKATNRGAL